jgi:hypothetical protein
VTRSTLKRFVPSQANEVTTPVAAGIEVVIVELNPEC